MVPQNIDRPMLVYPKLASRLGVNEAIIVGQIHYWIKRNGHFRPEDGQRWIWNSIDDWLEQFTWLSERTLRRTIRKLEKSEVLLSKRFRSREWNQTKWYRLNYLKLTQEIGWNPHGYALAQIDRIDEVKTNPSIRSIWPDRSGQNDPIDPVNLAGSSISPETTSKITFREKEENVLLKISEEEGKSQPKLPASLEVDPKSAGHKPKIADEGKCSAAVDPIAIKAKLAALIGPLDGEDGQRPQREVSRPIPSAYIEDVRETLSKHRLRLETLGIDLTSETLIEIINSHAYNLEPAIEAFLEKCVKGAIDHPERYLNAALRQGWKSRNNQSPTDSPKAALTPEFLEAYEQMCVKGKVLSVPAKMLPVVMGEVNVQVPRLNPKPWEAPYDLMPWRTVLLANTASVIIFPIQPDLATAQQAWSNPALRGQIVSEIAAHPDWDLEIVDDCIQEVAF